MKKLFLSGVAAGLLLWGFTADAQETTPSGIDWDQVATCRSGENWKHPAIRLNDSTLLYSGGLLLPQMGWVQYGGQEFALVPHQATRKEQIIVAERIAADPDSGGVEFAASLAKCEESMIGQS